MGLCFNPQPPRKTAATRHCQSGRYGSCFNPQPPRKTAATMLAQLLERLKAVSILSRPERRLQLLNGKRVAPAQQRFQSSAAPKDGCNSTNASVLTRVKRFQSSAAPKDGCNSAPSPTPSAGRCFNPQPPRKTAATILMRYRYARYTFQSSAAPKDGCN